MSTDVRPCGGHFVSFTCPTHGWVLDTFPTATVICGKCLRSVELYRARPERAERESTVAPAPDDVIAVEERVAAERSVVDTYVKDGIARRRRARLRKTASPSGVLLRKAWHDGLIDGVLGERDRMDPGDSTAA